ncbi:hypothetical protein DRW41_01005 [Neobacillus piezotolerans]|uniref:Transcriptional regulator n=1 Tax=Neobacillus piezotolerans TaxID=2259171 RepID=A0A3D8GVE5_9BACI|nr:hypothetical protein [Neobacillus piezotolerans]RDU38179.1 hypothetical protein DRW41_01005 [Neobacillus piezotolerans]
MKITVGVIGPEDSVNHILNFAESFDGLELIPFYYDDLSQIDNIVHHNQPLVDQWFFSGQVPYTYAVAKNLATEENSYYPPLYGASLLGKVVEANLEMDKVLKVISLDTIQEEELDTTKRFFSLQDLKVFSYSYPDYRPNEEIIRFHQQLYEEGKSEVAFTCLRGVYDSLIKLGIPCYRIFPSQLSIYFALRILKERGESSLYQRSQLALLGIEMIQAETNDEFFNSYEHKHKELNLKSLLIEIAERVNGSFVQIGDGLYFIYTTRGEIEIKIDKKDLYHLIDTVYSRTNFKLRIGLGYGITALQAEENVQAAFRHARKRQDPAIVQVDENRQVTEFISDKDDLTICFQNWTSDGWAEKLRKSNISPSSLSKIQALSNFYKKMEVNSHDVAVWLGSSERNARRILLEMETLGLAKSKTVRLDDSKGRPRKVYRLLLNEQAGKP